MGMSGFERALLAAASFALVLMLLGSACHALGDHGAARHGRQGFSEVADIPKDAAHEKRKERSREVHAQLAQMRSAAALAAQEAQEEQEAQEWVETADSDAYAPSEGLTQQSGVNYYGNRRETFYSSQVLYHYKTGEWTADDEGFYRTDEGYYVVAASDMPQGTVFDTSKGKAIVLDCGCANGTTDFYVNWG